MMQGMRFSFLRLCAWVSPLLAWTAPALAADQPASPPGQWQTLLFSLVLATCVLAVSLMSSRRGHQD